MEDWRTSVLMAAYHRAEPAHLAEALESMFSQTLAPDEIVFVEDGPLGEPLRRVLDSYQGKDIPLVRVALAENSGLAVALQAGLDVARYPWIVRMDADDISVPHRLATQMAALREGGIDVIGSAVSEFDGDPTNVVGMRSLPLDHHAIVRYARMNNPINHPSVVMRREHLVAVGGYRSVPFMEDYDLFARLLAHGSVFRNLAEPLLLFRAGDAMFSRRTAPGMFRAERLMQRNLVGYGLVSRPRSWLNLVARSAFRALPRSAMRRSYRVLFYRSRDAS
ncbi:glycosyltransferase [Agrococcus sp. Marseille-Q4369]|uniref:glycosyltransferase n=1 Tax=Agrococcus sp. Marseille-Q4369 TaxID=2810513 RepID=UPI001B8B426B|nr:glycosyltransferase [Agrococcus sp. Marseille-Q4369]QUW18568.1 glycosyltransferase [Agrococcus sp. Marseille-Q4369]